MNRIAWISVLLLILLAGSVLNGQEGPGDVERTVPAATELLDRGVGDDEMSLTELPSRRYWLAFIIATLTGIGVIVLIWLTFSGGHTRETRYLALHMIAVALIVEGVVILSVIHAHPDRYEALFAAIAGYVLGSLGKRQEPPEEADSRTRGGDGDGPRGSG